MPTSRRNPAAERAWLEQKKIARSSQWSRVPGADCAYGPQERKVEDAQKENDEHEQLVLVSLLCPRRVHR